MSAGGSAARANANRSCHGRRSGQREVRGSHEPATHGDDGQQRPPHDRGLDEAKKPTETNLCASSFSLAPPSHIRRMVDDHLRDSPPAAYPCAGQFSSFSPGAPPPRSNSPASNPWARSGTFLLSGSTAPPIVNTRRPPPLRGHSVSSSSVSTQLSQGQSSRQGSPVLMTEAACCCCATRVRFPRDSPCYRCTVCEVTNDLPPKQKRRRLSSDR